MRLGGYVREPRGRLKRLFPIAWLWLCIEGISGGSRFFKILMQGRRGTRSMEFEYEMALGRKLFRAFSVVCAAAYTELCRLLFVDAH